MGLAHLAGVLKSTNNLNAVPGSMESLMLMSCLFPKKEEEFVVAASSSLSGNDRTLTTREERRKEKQLQSNDSSTVGMAALKTREAEKSRYEPCLKISLKLGLAVIKYAFTPRALQELRLARQRLNRKLVHPDVEFARLKATQMKLTFLDRRFPFSVSDNKFTHSHRSQEYCKVGGANSLLPSWVNVNPLEKKKTLDDFNSSSSSSSILQLPVVLGKPKSPLSNAKKMPSTSVQPPTLARESSANGQKVHQQQPPSKSLSAASSSAPALLSQMPNKPPLAHHSVGEVSLGEEEVSEIRHFYALKKEFRQCYLATRTLRTNIDSRTYFDRDFKPAKLPSYDFYATGLSEKNLSVCVGEIESLIFHNYANLVCPRHLNPTQGLYWCAQFILEFLHQETFSGGGFDNSNDSVVKKLKVQVSALQQELVAGSKGIKKGGGIGGHRGAFPVADGGQKALVKIKQQHKAPPSSKLSLFEKLQLAAREANVEAQMDTLQAKMRDKGMMINKEERLAQIDKTLKSGIQTMRSIAAIQADMSEAGSDDEDDWMDEDISLSSQQKRQQQQLQYVSDDHSNSTGSRRKNAAEKVTKFFDAKNDKHYFGAGPQDHLTEFLGNPMVREINYFRRMLKTVGLVENASGKNMAEAGNRSVSVIWSYTPTAEEIQQKNLLNRKARIGGGKISKEEEARLYAEEIHRFQKQKEEEDKDKAKEMEDSQEMEISKTRAYKLGVLQEARAHRKEMLTESAAILKKKEEDQKMLARSENTRRKNEKKKLEDDKRLEAARIGDIRAWDRSIQQREADVAKERQEMEKIRLRNMASEKEYREIIRRNKEEARMKYLEERRRYLENRSEIEEAKAQAILDEKRRIFKAERILATARVRKGNFHHYGPDGKLAFYDDVRNAPVDWVQFEDASNVPYYYDPITKRTTYERPTDADVHHHSIDDRIAYDKEHGHGAYDEKNFNVAMKQSVNEYGGYYDAESNWIEVNGWFDEYDVFWDYNIGWFDEQGKWNLRPVVTGDLSFMV